jgi:hypothetical protein
MAKTTIPQNYPRLGEGEVFAGFLDNQRIVPHKGKLTQQELREIIVAAIAYANRKSSRAILDIPANVSDQEAQRVYFREGSKLFAYFKRYYGDPATTAYECQGRHYREIAAEQFHNRTLQKERMNSGWRYQRIASRCAEQSRRFQSVSDLGAAEADFNVVVDTVNYPAEPVVNIYISVKNRVNTLGGQDWPKAISALEEVAKNDKNRHGPYLCVFGIAMDRGEWIIKKEATTRIPYSSNAEVWLADFFWPFLSNQSYEEVMLAVYDVFAEQGISKENRTVGIAPPSELVEAFGAECRKHGLVDAQGIFNDGRKLVRFFCQKLPRTKRTDLTSSVTMLVQ